MKCLHCGAEFEPRVWNQKYCSRKCFRQLFHKRHYTPRPKPTYVQVCAVCGKEFEAKNSTAKYCSPECYRAAHPPKYKSKATRQATCLMCGAEFVTGKPNQIYCSRLCCRAAERRRNRLTREGQSFLINSAPPAKPAIEIAPEPQPTPIDEFFPPFHIPREVIIPAAVAENRQPTIEELLDWIFREERSA